MLEPVWQALYGFFPYSVLTMQTEDKIVQSSNFDATGDSSQAEGRPQLCSTPLTFFLQDVTVLPRLTPKLSTLLPWLNRSVSSHLTWPSLLVVAPAER